MKRVRKPILQTNILNVAFICIFFAPFMSAMTENLKIIIASVLSVPIVLFLLFILWLKYGYSGIHLNSINVCVMLMMLSVYSSIPLFSIIWGNWLGWLTIIIHVLTFVFGFINRDKLVLRLNGIKEEGKEEPSRFILYYALGIVALGIVGYVTLQVTLATSGSNVFVFGFFHLLSYFLFAISPAFLIHPDRALELGAISQSHYDEYN